MKEKKRKNLTKERKEKLKENATWRMFIGGVQSVYNMKWSIYNFSSLEKGVNKKKLGSMTKLTTEK